MLAVLGMAMVLFLTGSANAHETKLATGEIYIEKGGVSFGMQLLPIDIAKAIGVDSKTTGGELAEKYSDRIFAYVKGRLKVSMDGKPCELDSPKAESDPEGNEIALLMGFECSQEDGDVKIEYKLFQDIDPKHRFLGIAHNGGAEEKVFFDKDTTVFEFAKQTQIKMLWNMIKLGVEHILSGYDHLLFLFALIMVQNSFMTIVKTITAFTVAHSLTLALAWFGVVTPPAALVEVLIAVSIAYVAIENIMGWGKKHRWQLAGAFGLIHGMGFFSVLKELGLESVGVVTTLFGFNLGVEIGQLSIVLLMLIPLTWWWKRSFYPVTMKIGSVLVLLMALWWVYERTIGMAAGA